MKRSTQTFYRIAVLLGALTPGFGLLGCSHEEAQKPQQDDGLAELGTTSAELGVEVVTCSQSGSTTWTSVNKTLTLTLPGASAAAIMRVSNGNFNVNGYVCVDATGRKLVVADVSKVVVTGTAGADKFILDLQSGSFGTTIFGTAGGFTVDLAGGSDTFSVRGTAVADKYTAGIVGADMFFEVTGDKNVDVKVSNTEAFNVSLGLGDDTFSATGNATFVGPQFTPAVVAASVVQFGASSPITVYGGGGNDTLQGGDGIDTLNGGDGNDTFKTAVAPDGADTYVGGAGVDLMDYTGRTAALAVSLDGTGNDGDSTINAMAMPPGENDNVGADVENITGGSAADVLTGNAAQNVIKGMAGNDTISGGVVGMASCSGILDTLDGGDGNDTFNMGSLQACAATLIGGAGTDKADFQLRTNALTLSIDGVANDGEGTGMTAENSNIKTDIEVIVGGTGNDTITGSANADELHGGSGNDVINAGAGDDVISGGPGNDTLNGQDGNDTFLESGNDSAITAVTARGTGADLINGGVGANDVIDYSARTAAITATLCVDSAAATGASMLTTLGCGAANLDGESMEGDDLINVESYVGGTGIDTVTGSTADETIDGGAGADVLSGGDGNDTLFGGAGDDTLNGNAGDDYLDDTAVTTPGTTHNTFDGGTEVNVCITAAADITSNCQL